LILLTYFELSPFFSSEWLSRRFTWFRVHNCYITATVTFCLFCLFPYLLHQPG